MDSVLGPVCFTCLNSREVAFQLALPCGGAGGVADADSPVFCAPGRCPRRHLPAVLRHHLWPGPWCRRHDQPGQGPGLLGCRRLLGPFFGLCDGLGHLRVLPCLLQRGSLVEMRTQGRNMLIWPM
ncbi:unnamed protein product [Effrenium voratum]|nr:unnamed protein product [Effrenium voratum]